MRRSAEVVIAGAGVVGASVAYHLAARGCRDVLVLERGEALGGGSTGRATGGFRAQFATEVNTRLSLLSRAKLLGFREEVGADPDFRQCGYLFLARDEADMSALRAALGVQREAGLAESREVGPDEAASLNPALSTEGVVGGTFCPTDGFMRPMEILRGYAGAAERLGVRFAFGEPVVGVERAPGDRVASVRTPVGRVEARWFVNAAGAWAGEVGRLAGVEVPVAPVRRQIASTVPTDALPADMPMTLFVEDGFHLRVRDGRVLLGWFADTEGAGPYDTSFDAAWLDGLLERTRARVPRLAAVPIDREACWAGLYEVSPDKHAILGRAPGLENLYLANGSSGHGVMHSPALGQLLAEMILDGRASTLDVSALSPSRFAEGRALGAPELL